MADYSLALGVRPLQLEDPLTAYSKFAAIQNAQNQNALAQYKLSAAQREDESTNALRQLFSDPKNVDQTSPEFIRSVYGVSPEAGIKYAKSIAEMRREQGTFDKTESELLTAELARSRGLMGQAQTPEELASIVSNSYNPQTRTGKYFASQGLNVNTALEAIEQTKNDPQAFYTLLESFASNGDKLIENIRAKAQAFQMRPQPTFGRTSAGTPAAQENALGMRLGTPVPTPTQNALGAPAAGGVNTTAIPTSPIKTRSFLIQPELPAPAGAAAAPTSFATDRLAKIEQEIDQLEDVLAQYPGNKLAADRLQLKIGIRDKLVAEVSPKPQVVDLNNKIITVDMNPRSPTYGTELTSRIKGATPSGPSSLAVMQAERDALPPGDPRRAELDQKIKKETQTALSSLAMKQAERDALPPGDPRRDELDRAIKKETENAPSSIAVMQAEANALPVGDPRRRQIEQKIEREIKESLPSDVLSYEFAQKQGYPHSYTQWVKDKATWGRAPASPPAAAPLERVFDTKTGSQELVDRSEIRANPGRYKPLGAEEKLRNIPETINKGLTGNVASISQIDRAIEAVTKNPNSVGIKGNFPQAILNRADPQGVETRALITDVGSAKVHDRSGAAVAASEAPRLMPFIPQATDDAATVVKKLRQLKTQIETEQSGILDFYSQEQGYKPSLYHRQQSTSVAPAATPATRPSAANPAARNSGGVDLSNPLLK
jgi:hypothetical protein